MKITTFEAARALVRSLGDAPDEEAEGSDHPRVPGYVIDREIGAGGGGRVFAGRSETTDVTVAIKVLRATTAAGPAIDRAWREIEILAGLQLACVPRILDYGEAEGHLFIVSVLVPGRRIDEAARDLPLRERVTLLARAASALHELHERGVIHRDVKPSNLLVDTHGDLAVIDLGTAALRETEPGMTLTAEGAPIGSPAFMPPEQARGERGAISVRSDVHGLGATAYLVLSGTTPHAGEGGVADVLRRVATQPPRPLRRVAPTIPEDLAAVVMKAIEPDPRRRYASAEALAADLERWLRGEPPLARPASGLRRLRFALARSPLLAGSFTAAIFLVGAGAALGAQWLAHRAVAITAPTDDASFHGAIFSSDYYGTGLGVASALLRDDDAPPLLAIGMPGAPDRRQRSWIPDAGMLAFLPLPRVPRTGRLEFGAFIPEATTTLSGRFESRIARSLAALGDLDGDGLEELSVSIADDPRAAILLLRGSARHDAAAQAHLLDPQRETDLPTLDAGGVMRVVVPEGRIAKAHVARALGNVMGDARTEIAIHEAPEPGAVGAERIHLIHDLDWNAAVEGRYDLGRPGASFVIEPPDPATKFGDLGSIEDLDGDGRRELLVALLCRQEGRTAPSPGRVLLIPSAALRGDRLALADAWFAHEFRGVSDGDWVGHSFATPGDLDGDGWPDLVIGAPEWAQLHDDGGGAYILFGSPDWALPGVVDLGALDGTNGFVIEAPTRRVSTGDHLGDLVVPAGDFNGDGRPDVAIAAPRADVNGIDSGAVYVLLGAPRPFPARVEVGDDAFGLGIVLRGAEKGDQFGDFIVAIPDLDGDGRDELLVGASGGASSGASQSGNAYLFLGRSRFGAWLAR